MGATKRKPTKPKRATLAPVTSLFPALGDLVSVEMLRAGLADLVPATIQLLQQHQGETFAERWWSCAQLSQMILQTLPVVEDCLHSGRVRRGTEEQVLLAPPVLAFPLAAMAFAPGGVRIADLHWEAQHPMAAATIPFRITEDDSSDGWDKPIGQATVTRLKLWLPMLMAANAALSQEEMAIEMAEVGSFGSDDAIFSEALVVGGSDKQMGEAFIQLARTLAAMAFVPGGVPIMGYRWEARPRNVTWPAETPASRGEPAVITLELRPDLPVLALVSCVGRKVDGPVPARDLYTSDWFLKARALVEARGWPWRVLSAKHGLLRPDEPVERYDLTLKKMQRSDRQKWATRVLAQLDEELAEPHQLLVFAGDRYVEFLLTPLASRGHLVVRPLQGLGIGQQLRALLDLHGAAN